jgi:putative phage tail fiber protein
MDIDIQNNLYWDSLESENLAKLTLNSLHDESAHEEDVILNYGVRNSMSREIIFGTMPNNEDMVKTLHPGDSYIIPKGYHSGNSVISTESIEKLTSGTATAEDIAVGKTAYVNGRMITGTLDTSYLHNNHGTATAADIKDKKTAWSDGQLIVGTMPDRARHDISILAGQEYTLPEGYYSGSDKIIGVSLDKQTIANASANDIKVKRSAWVNGQYVEGTYSFENELKAFMSNTNASADDVRPSVSFYSSLYEKPVGGTAAEYINQPSRLLKNGENYTIPKGFHDGNGIISVPTLADSTTGSATKDDIMEGKVAWVNGEKIIGVAHKIISNATDTTATESDISIGKSAYINGHKVYGININDTIDYMRYEVNDDVDNPVVFIVPIDDWDVVRLIRIDIYGSDDKIESIINLQNYKSGDIYKNGNITVSSIRGFAEINIVSSDHKKLGVLITGYTKIK